MLLGARLQMKNQKIREITASFLLGARVINANSAINFVVPIVYYTPRTLCDSNV